MRRSNPETLDCRTNVVVRRGGVVEGNQVFPRTIDDVIQVR